MDKCELLAEVKGKIENRGYVVGEYGWMDGDQLKCCAIGYALETFGMNADELIGLRGCSVGGLFHHHQSESLKRNPQYNAVAIEKAHNILTDSGIPFVELYRLQEANDSNYGDASVVLEAIRSIMTKNNC